LYGKKILLIFYKDPNAFLGNILDFNARNAFPGTDDSIFMSLDEPA
jgi:hypothetical protein